MITSPKEVSIKVAVKNLYHNGLFNNIGYLTPLGQVVADMGKYDLRTKKMIIAGYYFRCLADCIILGAIIFTCGRGISELFIRDPELSIKETSKELINNLRVWLDQYGDLTTMLIIYKNSRSPRYYEVDNSKPPELQKNLKEKK